MRRSTKIKVAVARLPVRKTVVVPSALSHPSRRGLPAWIAAAATVTSRVRDGLVLRAVGVKEKAKVRKPSHGVGAR
ncbi:MAG: hypothetical protein CK548_07585 [Opitutia bacterium]|nr:hypothetical protein [Opitutaceae bacterium]PHX71131.1 MAG: hypothetical protein CK548_07585 [Opitutae bacterium]